MYGRPSYIGELLEALRGFVEFKYATGIRYTTARSRSLLWISRREPSPKPTSTEALAGAHVKWSPCWSPCQPASSPAPLLEPWPKPTSTGALAGALAGVHSSRGPRPPGPLPLQVVALGISSLTCPQRPQSCTGGESTLVIGDGVTRWHV